MIPASSAQPPPSPLKALPRLGGGAICRPQLPALLLRARDTAILALAVGAACTLRAQAPAAVPTMPATQFTQSIGVNVHMEYTDGKYADAPTVLRDLGYLGIAKVRDGVPQPNVWLPKGQAMQAIDLLASAGIHFDFVVPAGTKVSDDMAQMRALDMRFPRAVLSVEGPNEINNWPVKVPGMTSEQAAMAFQRNLYAAVHKDPQLGGAPVIYFTGGSKIDLSAHPGLADDANTHPYPHGGAQPGAWLARDYAGAYTMPAGSFPWQITETGYYTDPASRDWGGVDDDTQARLLVNTLFDAARLGVGTTYIYQLLDPYPYGDRRATGADGHCGLFFYNGKPKPSAEALRRLLTLTAGGAGQQDAAPRVMVQGLPPTGHALELWRGDGTVLVALWNEIPAWDAATQRPLHPDAVPVTVRVPGAEEATVEDPVSGKSMTARRGSEGYVVKVPDSVVLLVIQPSRAASHGSDQAR